MFGRTVIYSSADKIDESNVVSVLYAALDIHTKNKLDIDYLYKYYKGDQPILLRTKSVRPEITNRIVENHAYEIVDFKKGHVFGEPVQYVMRGSGTDDVIAKQINELNEYMIEEDKAEEDKQLGEWLFISGTSYRKVMPAKTDFENPFGIETLDPRNTFVVYSNGFKKKALMAVQEVTMSNLIDPKKKTTLYCVYTATHYYEIEDSKILDTPNSGKPHIVGYIPIIEYPANTSRLGAFETVLSMLDALNTCASNRLDGIEQFIQSFIKFVNCDIDEATFAALKEMGAIKIASKDGNQADVDIISSELSQEGSQVAVDYLYQIVLTICGMPDRNGASKTTGDTGKAVSMRDGWEAAESRARDVESIFKKSERQFLRIVLKIMSDKGFTLETKNLDIQFPRNKTDNIVTKTQALTSLLLNGIDPLIAITICGLFGDPLKVFKASEQTLAKWYTTEAEKPNDTNKGEENNGNT